MRCNCENVRCPICRGSGCTHQVGKPSPQRFMHIGVVCNPCADHMPSQYKVEESNMPAKRTIRTKDGHRIQVEVPQSWDKTYTCVSHGTQGCQDPTCLSKGRFQSVKF